MTHDECHVAKNFLIFQKIKTMIDSSPRLVASRARSLVDRVRDKAPGDRPLEAQAFLLAGYQLLQEFEGHEAADAAVHRLIAATARSGEAAEV